jgi:hypothetical protein
LDRLWMRRKVVWVFIWGLAEQHIGWCNGRQKNVLCLEKTKLVDIQTTVETTQNLGMVKT